MTKELRPENIVWEELGFSYIKTDYRWIQYFEDGKWQEGTLSKDNQIHLPESSTSLNYGQQCFEGMKAYRAKDGSINLFRPDENAKRMYRSAQRLMMEPVPVENYIEAIKKTVKANEAWIPPYGSGASLYIRPILLGVGDNLAVQPSSNYLFIVFCSPVGPYYPDGLAPTRFITTEYDRAAPHGTGASKVGGNYGSSLLPYTHAQEQGYGDAIYLNPKDHSTIEEIGSSNFIAFTEDDTLVTPKSESVLPGVTRKSIMELAENRFGLEVQERRIKIKECANFVEAGACGTAAVITPIAGIQHEDTYYEFYSESEPGPWTQKFYEELVGIQYGEIQAPDGWIYHSVKYCV